MARKELIRELKIRRDEIYAEIKKHSPHLVLQLEAINSMIDVDTAIPESVEVGDIKQKGTPKGKTNWIDYVYNMLEEIGGSGKTKEVAKAISDANSNIPYQRAKDACGDKLSKLAKAGRIKATKGNSPIDGYLYEII